MPHDDTAIERWADPPATRGGGGGRVDYKSIIDTLRRRPRTWALVWEEVAKSRIQGLQRACPQLEVTGRGERQVAGRKRVDVYARYIPKAIEAVS